ncbi:hypothetical protein RI129_002858 [Pyrocoelia pectoralis]|uniref:THAP-type domain-containing protein n=1 Tax=Pyrocoelia pectoralis TaxID=417401 RepID=A0AAN7VMP1_9COLE
MEPSKRCYKWCFVPMCTNTTFTTPEKTFLTMPRDVKIRKMWFKAARRDYSKITSSDFYCCEDHFDNDKKMLTRLHTSNANEFRLLMRKGVLPYDYLDSWERLHETVLPPRNAFFSHLKNEADAGDENEPSLDEAVGIDNSDNEIHKTSRNLQVDQFLLVNFFTKLGKKTYKYVSDCRDRG